MKVLSLFSGIGAFEKALNRIGIETEIVNYCEIDKYASKAYSVIHNVPEDKNLGDITKIEIEKLPRFIDMITHGSPCQDFSVAGKQAGGDEGTGTRSSLMWNTVDIVKWCLPKYVIWENVKNLLSKKHKHNFDSYIEIMEELGYNSYYQVLNAKDYGIPQNRERVYTISIRKDIDKCNYKFPEKEILKLRLKDLLEDIVDEKYYLTDKGIKYFKNQAENRGENLDDYKEGRMLKVAHGYDKGANINLDVAPTLDTQFSNNWRGVLLEPKCVQVGQSGLVQPVDRNYKKHGVKREEHIEFKNDDCSHALRTNQGQVPVTCVQVGELDMKGHEQMKRFYSPEGLSPTLTTMGGGQREPKVIEYNSGNFENLSEYIEYLERVKEELTEEYSECDKKIVERTPLKFLNRNQKKIDGDYAFCVDSSNTGGVKEITDKIRIRKLTPKECWRLMGFDDEDFEKVANIPTSNTQLYKMAGNSIVVNVLEKIFKNLLMEETNE